MGNENTDRTKTAKKMIPGAKEPVVESQKVDEETVLSLIAGDIDPSSDVVSYFISKCLALGEEGAKVESQYREVMAAKDRIEKRATQIRCEMNAAKHDLAEWHSRAVSANYYSE